MKIVVALLLGILIGAGALWFLGTEGGRNKMRNAGQEIESATRNAKAAVQEQMQVLHLRPQDIAEELDKSGQVVRRKAKQAGQAIADATADARVTAAIKGKLLTDPNLSARTISVNTTDGVVTLSGSVTSREDIGKAMLLAMEVEGVKEVISTLQAPRPAK